MLPAISVLLFACLVFNIGVLAGQYSFSSIKTARSVNLSDRASLEGLRDDAQRAALFDPLEARYYYAAGMIESRVLNNRNAVNMLDHAVTLDPMNSAYIQRLGLALYRNEKTEAGDRLILAGTTYDVANPERYKFCAIHLFSTGRHAEAIGFITKAISISPARAEDLIILMMLRGMNDQEIGNALPERSAAHIAYATYLEKAGKQADADKAYGTALYYAGLEKKLDRANFINIIQYYVKRELFDYALNAARQGIQAFPNDGELHYKAGLIYEKLNMNTTAMTEYKRAVALDVSNTEARNRIYDLSRTVVGP
jgi:tetratricopeptide (TPR) repeat protein